MSLVHDQATTELQKAKDKLADVLSQVFVFLAAPYAVDTGAFFQVHLLETSGDLTSIQAAKAKQKHYEHLVGRLERLIKRIHVCLL